MHLLPLDVVIFRIGENETSKAIEAGLVDEEDVADLPPGVYWTIASSDADPVGPFGTDLEAAADAWATFPKGK